MNKKQKILLADYEEKSIKLMGAILQSCNYDIETAKSGLEALEKTKETSPDLILLDIFMPGMDGYEVCKTLKEDPSTQHIPVVMVTGLEVKDSKIKGLDAGANDFLTKPVDRIELILRVKNLLKVKEFDDFMLWHNQMLEDEVRKRIYELQDAMDDIERCYNEIKESYIETIHRLTLASEYKDEESANHIKRIGHYCKVISERLEKSNTFIETICYASPMHDIGKIGIPDSILLKSGELTNEEFEIVKSHTIIGARILSNSKSEFLRAAEVIALTHHERWDGSGYPSGLKGDNIPLMGRIVNIVDQYDSLRSKRPFKLNLSHERAYEIITIGDGRTMPGHFDPQILQTFKDTHKQFEEIYESLKD
ncbi:MAG: HD domain-containing phosphohydrolase [Thermodesulfovibrionales bacterium]